MSPKLKTLLKVFAYVSLLGILGLLKISYDYFTNNQIDIILNKGYPLGIQVALTDNEQDDRLATFAQLLIIPEHRMIAFYFINTEAYDQLDGDPVWETNPNSNDSFPIYTDISNQYYITVSKKNAIRIINLVEGLRYYNIEKLEFENQKFSYYEGEQYWSGEHVMEYMLHKRIFNSQTDIDVFDIDRLYRQETMLLSFLWNLPDIIKKTNSKLGVFMYSLLKTNFKREELNSLLNYMATVQENHIKVLEVPMAFEVNNKNQKLLVIKPEQAKLFFKQFREDLQLGKYISNDIVSYEILNATETNRIASRLKSFLQARNVNVLSVGNYQHQNTPKTFFLNHSGHTFSAVYLINILKLKKQQVFFRRSFSEISDKLVIGQDMNPKNFRIKK